MSDVPSIKREIGYLMFGLLICFFVIASVAAYWAVIGADTILLRDDNPRLVEDAARIRRGALYDRHDTLLVESKLNDAGILERFYRYPATYSFTGYFSLRYGAAGAELAYDTYLRGDIDQNAFERAIEQDLLHLPQQGADIRLTLDLDVQQVLSDAMQGQRGAAVMISIPDGAVLALLSSPTYDPNTLNAHWDELVAAVDKPFFNRVLQGQYQPGGMLQTPLMVAALLTEQPFDTVISRADQPIDVNGQPLGCASTPPSTDLTYAQAYAYGCPYAFSILAEGISQESLRNIFSAFDLASVPGLTGFISDDSDLADAALTSPQAIPNRHLLEDIIGQGHLTISPLSMAIMTSAVINNGNALDPHAFSAYRHAGDAWVETPVNVISRPIMTAHVARQLRDLMIQNVHNGTASAATRDDLVIGGHSALAIAGDETQVWFVGFVQLADNRGAVIAIVLEDSIHAESAADIGGTALEQAAAGMRSH